MFEEYSLKNKARVILVPQEDTQSVTVLVKYPLGSRYETEKLSGVSHYIEHLMFKGTEKRKNTLVLTREIDRLGAAYNAYTGKEYTGYYIKTAAKYTNVALDILSDMLFRSTFDPKEMEREKGPIVEELRMYRDNPIMNIDNVFEELMFDGCPLGRDIGGTPEHVMSFKRDEVLAFKRKFYGPNNMTIIVAGKILPETKQWIETYFGQEANTGTPSRVFKPAVFGPSAKSARVRIEKKATDQTQMMIGFPGFQYGAKELAAVSVMNTILGGSMSSRLFISVRERNGLVYTIRSGHDSFRDIGYQFVRAALEPKNIQKALTIIQKEIAKIQTTKVSKKGLADAKTHIRGSMTLALEDSSEQADWYARQAIFQKHIKTPEERLAEIDQVTAEDVQKIAKKLFKTQDMRIACIGNLESGAITL
jgi:predicted Zn-dependent peptidase